MTARETFERIKGRRGVRLRKLRLAREPLCRHCLERGRISAAVTPDHIVPIGQGGQDVDSNVQALCEECHALKTAAEDTAHQGYSTHPAWLERSAIPLTIVCGPPCSGKTTYVRQHAAPFDSVIEFDDIARSINPAYVHWQGMLTHALRARAIRKRNAMLGALARARSGKAWFTVAAPTSAERAWWQGKLGGDVVLLHPGIAECERRARHRGTPQALQGIREWEAKAREVWRSPIEHNRVIGLDGWPRRN